MAMKALLHHIRCAISVNTSVASCFIQATGSPLQKTPLGVYRSLIHQLYQEFPGAFTDLTEMFKRRTKELGEVNGEWAWTPEEMLEHLSQGLRIISQHYPIFILIDALDESGEESAREIVEAMKLLLSDLDCLAQLRICISCRHCPQITLDEGRTIILEDSNTDDINQVVGTRLKELNFTPAENQLLQDEILQRSNGIFQRASLVVDTIIDSRRRGFEFKEILPLAQELPTDLHHLYKFLLQPKQAPLPGKPEYSLHEQKYTLKLFQWVLFAARPLTPIELQQALTLDECMSAEESIAEYQTENDSVRLDNLAVRVKDLSKGLVRLSGSVVSGQVQFIHQSVPDFLDGPEKVLESLSPLPTIPMERLAHFRLSRSCLRYLFMLAIPKDSSTESSLDWLSLYSGQNNDTNRPVKRLPRPDNLEFPEQSGVPRDNLTLVKHSFDKLPLILYAWKHWAFHVESAQKQGFEFPDGFDEHDPLDTMLQSTEISLERLYETLKIVFGSPMASCYHRLHEDLPSERMFALLRYKPERSLQPRVFPLRGEPHEQVAHSLAFCGFVSGLARLAETQPALLERRDNYGYHALAYAIEGKQVSAVRILLQAGCDLNTPLEGNSYTPLSLACIWGDAEVVSLMIKAGAEVNPEGCHVSPLHCAAFAGHRNVIDLLMKAGAKINNQKRHGFTSLHALAFSKKANLAMVSQLMNHGARMDITDDYLRNPLHISVQRSSISVFKEFLKATMAFEKKNKYRMRLLSAMSKLFMRYDFTSCIIDRRDVFGTTPFSLALSDSDCERLKLLYEAGADTRIYVSEDKEESVSRLLQDAGLQQTTGDSLESVSEEANSTRSQSLKWMG